MKDARTGMAEIAPRNGVLSIIAHIFFCFVWVVYGANVLLWALSGYCWTKAAGFHW